jgi:FemAB-related protein (PEP-CTERM system-associated)
MSKALRHVGLAGLLDGEGEAAWDAYCGRHPAATPYHLRAWGRAVALALAHEPRYLQAEDAGRVVGVLPLFLRRSRLFGTSVVSVPAANVCGPLADDEATLNLLVDAAIAWASERNVEYLEVRDVAPGSESAKSLTLDPGRYVSVEIDLRDGEAAVWSRLSKGIRRRVRRANDAGLSVELSGSIDAFYEVYAATMKRLGSPPFAKRFFAALRDGFGETLRFGVARLAGQVAAVDSVLTFRGTAYSVFAGSRADLWRLYPNQLLLWEEIKDACARPLSTFDLGRSLADSGSLEFKSAWGGRVVPLTYGYHLHRLRRIPARTPDMPLYRALAAVWSLLPDRVVTRIGPHIVKHLF